MRSLIIGGAGFAGGYLARHLTQTGQEAAATKMAFQQAGLPNVPFYDLDILDKEAVFDVMKKIEPDYIFHLAAQSSAAVSWKHPDLTIDVNVKGSINVLDAVRRLKKKPRVLLVGSGEEYGMAENLPVRETEPARPVNIYAAAKACQNMIGTIYARSYGLDVVMVRAFNHIGPGQAPVFAVSDFCKQAAEIEAGKKEAVIKTGSLDVSRDFTDVRDVVRAYALLVQKGRAGETYNVGSGHAVKMGDILQIVLKKAKVQIRVETDAGKLRPSDVPVMKADIQKIQKAAGWMPEIALEQTIEETLNDWRMRIKQVISREQI